MATSRGGAEMRRFIGDLPAKLEKSILRGAARAAGEIVAVEARANAPAAETRADIVVRARAEPGRVTVRVGVKPGWGRTLGIWSEYGTDPHFISIADEDRQGRSVRRVNEQSKSGSLVIGSSFVGPTVFHPGARAHPFLRPALDTREGAALAAAQGYINSRITKAGIVGASEPEEAEG